MSILYLNYMSSIVLLFNKFYLQIYFTENGKPFLLLGPPGTGKSVYIKDLLNRKLDHDKFASVTLYFTSNTSPTTTQDIIMSKLDKRRKGKP